VQTPTVQIVTASRKLIAELRSMDTHNRNKKGNHVEYIRKEIRAGRWTLTNQGIGVSVSNFIIDGGHRLEAIELEGCPPVQFILARGLPDNAQKYVDLHAKRSMADTLALFFESQISTNVVAALNVLIKASFGWDNIKAPPDMLIAKFQEVEFSINQLCQIERFSSLAAPVFAALVAAHQTFPPARILLFTEQLISGEMLQNGDPALTLRNWLASNQARSGSGAVQRQRYLKTFNAIEAFIQGRKLSKLYVKELSA